MLPIKVNMVATEWGVLGLILAVCILQHLAIYEAVEIKLEGGKPIRTRRPRPQPASVQRYLGESANVSRLLDSLLQGYDKRLRPNYKGPPVEVGITMHVSGVSSISEVDMDFTLDMYFRQFWKDSRLKFSEKEDELCISNEMLNKIWWPDTFFANAKDAKFHFATTKNAFLRIKHTGEITQSLRLTVTATCPMDLTYFPMDSQSCSLEIESYGYSVKDIYYKWGEGQIASVGIDPGVQLPQFKVRGYRARDRRVSLSTGNYSRLSCDFYFVRSLGYYIIQIYIPSILIVVLSWVSFWLSREAVPARVALGITTVLTMTTLISSTNASLPKISYLKSIDVYLVTCFVMVFAALLEFAAVSYMSNRANRQKNIRNKRRASDAAVEKMAKPTALESPIFGCRKGFTNDVTDPLTTEVRLKSMRNLHTECDLRSTYSNSHGGQGQGQGTCRSSRTPLDEPDQTDTSCGKSYECFARPSVIDKYSRILFPLTFILFNLMYWVTYMNISSTTDLTGFVTPDAS